MLPTDLIAGINSDSSELTIDGGDNMLTIDRLDHDKVIEVAQNMGYDPKKPAELTECINKISKMDLWDISQILFFGYQYVKTKESNTEARS
ncbi:MAG: hypothetical protein H6Q52_1845 [Deltaproteobacteria bacterium]|jgi:hypothetical protein|nr:hypothetical protein [Deltaproteobacteria bacterium]